MMPLTATPQDCEKRGQELTLYYNVGDEETPVWVEHVGIVGDLTMTETEELNQRNPRRSSRRTNEYSEGEVEVSISGTQVTDPLYEGWAMLYKARKGGTPVDVMCLSGLITEVGATGWRGMVRNGDRTWNGPETGGMTSNFNLQPAACADVAMREVQIQTPGTVEDFDPTSVTTVST